MAQLAGSAQAIDWAGIRAAAVTVGVREAARQASRDMPASDQYRFVNRVMQRCHREGWITRKAQVVQKAQNPLSAKVSNGADSLARTLADDSAQSRVGFSKAARKVAIHLGEKAPSDLIERDTAQSARQWTEIAGKVHGWDAKSDSAGVNVAVNIGIIGG